MTELTDCPECEGALDVVTYVCDDCGWDGMNQGDYHSGPYGYSPGVAYPGTQYGTCPIMRKNGIVKPIR